MIRHYCDLCDDRIDENACAAPLMLTLYDRESFTNWFAQVTFGRRASEGSPEPELCGKCAQRILDEGTP